MRPGYNEWNISKAQKEAERSRDPSTQCGAIIVRPDKTTCAEGYNGFPRNMPDFDKWWNNREEKYDRVIHAEMNALLHAYESVVGYTMFITHPMCKKCAPLIAAAGIAKVVWKHDTIRHKRFESDRAIAILLDSLVEVVVLDE